MEIFVHIWNDIKSGLGCCSVGFYGCVLLFPGIFVQWFSYFNCTDYSGYIKVSGHYLKFIYSEKAKKICKIFPLLLSVCTVDKSKGKISQNFVTFSEYTNFNTLFITKQVVYLHDKNILRRPQNFAKSPPYFCLQYIQTKVRWRFLKILWSSQNIWTLIQKK